MKNQKIGKFYALVFFAAFALIFSGCSKYEDGPAISLLTKTARLTGEWEVVEIDQEELGSDETMTLTFDKNGDFSMYYKYSYEGYEFTFDEKGDWVWADGKEVVEVTVDGERMDFEILRLTDSELWCEDEDNYEWRCEKK
jgi:hypothetical protein